MDVLIAENELSTILELKTILERLGHNILDIASTGEGAIEKVENMGPELIFINIQLKGSKSGVETAKEIEKLYQIPIIFVTAFIKNCLNKSLQLSEDAIVLSKPIKREHLEYAILRAINDNQ